MSPQKRNIVVIFVLGFAIGFTLFLWLTSKPCYNSANIFSFFTKNFQPCNALTLSQEKRKDAMLKLIPSTTVIKVGQSFSVSLVVDPKGININAVSVRITNTTNTVTIVSDDESMSPFLLHLTAPLAEADFKRVVQIQPNPGITTPAVIARFTFVAVAPGSTTIMIATSSLILANDGFGTDVLGSVQNATFTVIQ